jgi:DNA invertase Pin-like site-specific DNA recombinase
LDLSRLNGKVLNIEDNQKICAIYARVSPTKHLKEHTELHASLEEALIMCRRDAEREGYTIYKEYKDEYVSGKSSKHMPCFNQMMGDARAGKFSRIYSRRVNRFGRNRNDMLKAQIELDELGITLKFVENGLDTAQKFGQSIMGFMAELAQMEREEILENTTRGRIAAKERGQPFGPKKKDLDTKLIRKLRLMPANDPDKPSWAKLEAMYGAKRSTMIARLKEEGYWDYEKKTVK